MMKLEIQGVIHPDANMFAKEDFYQDEPNVVISITTQLYLNTGLEEWGDKVHSASKSDIKQLHLRNTFIPMHTRDITYEELHMVLELHRLLKKNLDGNIKGWTLAGGNKQ